RGSAVRVVADALDPISGFVEDTVDRAYAVDDEVGALEGVGLSVEEVGSERDRFFVGVVVARDQPLVRARRFVFFEEAEIVVDVTDGSRDTPWGILRALYGAAGERAVGAVFVADRRTVCAGDAGDAGQAVVGERCGACFERGSRDVAERVDRDG